MKIDIQVANLKQLQEWVTKTQALAEKIGLPKFSFFFGYCNTCNRGVHYPKRLVIHDNGDNFDIMCELCNNKLSQKYNGGNDGESQG